MHIAAAKLRGMPWYEWNCGSKLRKHSNATPCAQQVRSELLRVATPRSLRSFRGTAGCCPLGSIQTVGKRDRIYFTSVANGSSSCSFIHNMLWVHAETGTTQAGTLQAKLTCDVPHTTLRSPVPDARLRSVALGTGHLLRSKLHGRRRSRNQRLGSVVNAAPSVVGYVASMWTENAAELVTGVTDDPIRRTQRGWYNCLAQNKLDFTAVQNAYAGEKLH